MKRVILAVVCILTLPLLFSTSNNVQHRGPASFSTIALAGHTGIGSWCECGTPDCTCDPGETPRGIRLHEPDPDDDIDDQPKDSETDLTPGLMALALALFFWFRMR